MPDRQLLATAVVDVEWDDSQVRPGIERVRRQLVQLHRQVGSTGRGFDQAARSGKGLADSIRRVDTSKLKEAAKLAESIKRSLASSTASRVGRIAVSGITGSAFLGSAGGLIASQVIGSLMRRKAGTPAVPKTTTDSGQPEWVREYGDLARKIVARGRPVGPGTFRTQRWRDSGESLARLHRMKTIVAPWAGKAGGDDRRAGFLDVSIFNKPGEALRKLVLSIRSAIVAIGRWIASLGKAAAASVRGAFGGRAAASAAGAAGGRAAAGALGGAGAGAAAGAGGGALAALGTAAAIVAAVIAAIVASLAWFGDSADLFSERLDSGIGKALVTMANAAEVAAESIGGLIDVLKLSGRVVDAVMGTQMGLVGALMHPGRGVKEFTARLERVWGQVGEDAAGTLERLKGRGGRIKGYAGDPASGAEAFLRRLRGMGKATQFSSVGIAGLRAAQQQAALAKEGIMERLTRQVIDRLDKQVEIMKRPNTSSKAARGALVTVS